MEDKKTSSWGPIEWGLIAAGLSVVAIAFLQGIGPRGNTNSNTTPTAVTQPIKK